MKAPPTIIFIKVNIFIISQFIFIPDIAIISTTIAWIRCPKRFKSNPEPNTWMMVPLGRTKTLSNPAFFIIFGNISKPRAKQVDMENWLPL